MSKVKILFFAADPQSAVSRKRRLLLDEEARKIEEEVFAAVHGDRVDVKTCWATRITDLRRALNRFRPDVVHFSGHGGEDGLVLVASNGRGPQHVNAAALNHFFKAYRGQIKLVVLNACHSRLHAEAIADAVGCAIGTPSGILDDAAIDFSTAFYSSIASGNSVQTAFDQARATLKMEDFPDGEAPVLERREDVNPSDLVLIQPDGAPVVEMPAPLPPVRRTRRAAAATVLAVSFGALYLGLRPDPACAAAREVQRAVMAAGTPAPARMGLLSPPDDGMAGPPELVEARRLHEAGNHAADLLLFRTAAEGGNPEAMTSLGLAYLHGEGIPAHEDSAVKWLRKAAYADDPRGMTELGKAYVNGVGVDRNSDHHAKDWFEKAAATGYAEAMRNLGRLYAQGKGVPADGAVALEWYVKAAKAGLTDAMVDAGNMYEQGLGVARDSRQAMCWYRAAEKAGAPRGKVAIGIVDDSLGPEDDRDE